MGKYDPVVLFTRKVNKQEFKFIKNTLVCCITGKDREYLSIETPENCFGYPDTILFNKGVPRTMHRHQPKWIMKKLTEIAIKNGLEDLIYS